MTDVISWNLLCQFIFSTKMSISCDESDAIHMWKRTLSVNECILVEGS